MKNAIFLTLFVASLITQDAYSSDQIFKNIEMVECSPEPDIEVTSIEGGGF